MPKDKVTNIKYAKEKKECAENKKAADAILRKAATLGW